MSDDKREALLREIDGEGNNYNGWAARLIAEAGYVLRDRLETDAGLQEAFNRGYRDGRADQRTKDAAIVEHQANQWDSDDVDQFASICKTAIGGAS